MSNTMRDAARAAAKAFITSPPEDIAEQVKDTYPDISLLDAERIRDGLAAIFTARDKEDLAKSKKAYTALHSELKQKYKKSGKH